MSKQYSLYFSKYGASTAEPLHCLRLPPRHAPSITGAMLRTRRLAAVLARVARISGVADARSGDALPVAVAHKMTRGRGAVVASPAFVAVTDAVAANAVSAAAGGAFGIFD